MSVLNIGEPSIERAETTPIRSHISQDGRVEALCHHSGRYLTSIETNPIRKWFFREQHDFPGLVQLDRAFQRAAHAEPHQHMLWSKVRIRSLIMLPSSLILLGLLYFVFLRRAFVPGGVVAIAVSIVFTLLFAFAIYLLLFGLLLLLQNEQLFHRLYKHLPPAIRDYPVDGRFRVVMHEHLSADLTNSAKEHPVVRNGNGNLSVEVHPKALKWETLAEYRNQYAAHAGVGDYAHAGAVALDNLQHVELDNALLEFDHRVTMRWPLRDQTLDSSGQPQPHTVAIPYQIKESAFYPPHNGLKRFPLECEPELVPTDSRTLKLSFHWYGANQAQACWLEECILDIPDELGHVTKVSLGRYDSAQQQVIWRNRRFHQQHLILSLTFEEPILSDMHILPRLIGKFRFRLEGLMSRIAVEPERIWSTLGLRADSADIEIEEQTIISGSLDIEPQRLSQEHEFVAPLPPIVCKQPPSEGLVDAVINVLLDERFDLQRIMRATPRLDPTGRLHTQLLYWDIIGHRYDEELLDSLDIHVVISGSDRTAYAEAPDNFRPRTTVDLRVRCLHDPRNLRTVEMVEALVGGVGGQGLAAKIKDAIEKAVGPC